MFKEMINTHTDKTPEEIMMEYFIILMSEEVIPGVKPLTLSEIYELDIVYYMKLINFSRNNKINEQKEAIFVDLVGL